MPERFWRTHLFLPAIAFGVAAVILEVWQVDLLVADWFYSIEGHRWALRRQFITSDMLHDAAQDLTRAIGMLLLFLSIASLFVKRLMPYRRGFFLLFLSLASGSALVLLAKELTHVDCPWDLLRYGGEHPYIRIFEAWPGDYTFGRCFPSGHASAGYGFIALYFALLHYRPRWKLVGLATGLGLGMLFGLAQQLRGAHFLSHDLWTLAICWASALFWYWILFRREKTGTTEVIPLSESTQFPQLYL